MQMANNRRSQIYSQMNLKATDELIRIWQDNNRTEWPDTVFEVIEDILKERGERIPEQNEVLYELREHEPKEDDDGLEEWEAKVLDSEDQPAFYDTLDVLELLDNLNRAAMAVIAIYALLGLMNLSLVSALLRGIPVSFSGALDLLANDLFIIFTYGLQIVVTYFPLKALAHILRILMEMEFRSRKAL